ncbi:MAG TPA: hypothetical protein VH140_04165 [Candidatus Acidoferrum sp.]|jgi:hypothetical protein|nr:hypothetical protein [Candidatus Acidoferrum sp.]
MTSQNGPDQKRRLKETDIDPSGELTSDRTGETEGTGPGTGSRTDNQPAENRENPTRSENRESGNRDIENAPPSGHEE